MKIIELIRVGDLETYYIANTKFSLKKRCAEFILTSSKKELPDIIMVITYINLFPNNSLFMIPDITTKKLGFLISAVTESELGEAGKIMTKSLYALLSQKERTNHEKETHTFKGSRSELGVAD